MMSNECRECTKPTRNELLAKTIESAKAFASRNKLDVVAVVEKPNRSGYFLCAADDERCERLGVVQYLSFG